ncbi:MAG: 16S rRNA processing protein RimM [Pyrinomonadaceae bacterium]|nr:16S rRNA processing protein RimM [Pyrinomonadaceae bacterium]
MNEELNDFVAIAKTARTRGLRGEIIADVLTDFPKRFETTKNVVALKPNGEKLDLKIERFWFQKNRIILQFAGFDSIEKAETLVNCEICVPETETVTLETDEFFDWEIESCEVQTIDGESLGKVRELMRTGGTELLVVFDEKRNRDYLIPFAEKICVEVDVKSKLIKVDLPEGILEF